jgi:hypothetical protein
MNTRVVLANIVVGAVEDDCSDFLEEDASSFIRQYLG